MVRGPSNGPFGSRLEPISVGHVHMVRGPSNGPLGRA
jgi:hypothetical protein